MQISLSVSFWISLYILFVTLNVYLMRELLILDKDRVESFIDVIITFLIIFIPFFGTVFILSVLEEEITDEYKNKRRAKARKFINKLFHIR